MNSVKNGFEAHRLSRIADPGLAQKEGKSSESRVGSRVGDAFDFLAVPVFEKEGKPLLPDTGRSRASGHGEGIDFFQNDYHRILAGMTEAEFLPDDPLKIFDAHCIGSAVVGALGGEVGGCDPAGCGGEGDRDEFSAWKVCIFFHDRCLDWEILKRVVFIQRT